VVVFIEIAFPKLPVATNGVVGSVRVVVEAAANIRL
jgi:hypothetical protein